MCFNIVMNKLWRVQNRLENERRKRVYQQAILLSIWFFFFFFFLGSLFGFELTTSPSIHYYGRRKYQLTISGDESIWYFVCLVLQLCLRERERERERGLLITFSPSTVFLTYAVTKVQMYIYANLFSVMSAT